MSSAGDKSEQILYQSKHTILYLVFLKDIIVLRTSVKHRKMTRVKYPLRLGLLFVVCAAGAAGFEHV